MKRRLLTGLLCMALVVTDIVPTGLTVQAEELTQSVSDGIGGEEEEEGAGQDEPADGAEEDSEQGEEENLGSEGENSESEGENSESEGENSESEEENSESEEENSENGEETSETGEETSESEEENSEDEEESYEIQEDDQNDGEETETFLASGTIDEDYGKITWSIDKSGTLTVKGTGDFAEVPKQGEYPTDRAPWYAYRESITSAVVKVKGMTCAAYMFRDCTNLSSVDFSGFNTSKVTDMTQMFYKCKTLSDVDVSGFNTGSVVSMDEMFRNCENLSSLNLTSFNTGNVTSMEGMFYGCKSLYSIYFGEDFTTRKVTNMSDMFHSCSSLSVLDVTTFDTSNVTDMCWMFADTPLSDLDLSGFDTGKVTDMHDMFAGCGVYWLDLSGFDTGNVTGMQDMFKDCAYLTSLDLSDFNTGKVTDMHDMFSGCSSLQSLDLSGFNTGKVTDMSEMFSGCSGLQKLDLSGFDTGKVTDMEDMFSGCSGLTSLDLSSFNLGALTQGGTSTEISLFSGTSLSLISVPYNLKKKISLPVDAGYVWRNGSGTAYAELPKNLSQSESGWQLIKVANKEAVTAQGTSNNLKWNLSGGKLTVTGSGDWESGAPWSEYADSITSAVINVTGMTNASNMFAGCSSLISVDMTNFDTSQITDMSDMFDGCTSLVNLNLGSFNTEKVTNMSYMFTGCTNLKSLDLSSFNTANVTNMGGMFYSCTNLKSLDLSSFNTGEVTNMKDMFIGCTSLKSLDLSSFETGKVTDMQYMFFQCDSLTSLNLSSFETGKVTDMQYMFFQCDSLTSLNLSSFNTENVTDMGDMFSLCDSLNSLDLSSFDTSKVKDVDHMFFGCDSLNSLDLSNFDLGALESESEDDDPGERMIEYAALTTIKVPYNLQKKILLPDARGGAWCDDSGKTYTELPQNLSKSESGLQLVKCADKPVQGTSGDIVWSLIGGKLTVTGTGDYDAESVPWSEYSERITSAVINVTGMTNASKLFYGCKNLTNVDMTGFDTSLVTDMSYMFYECESLTGLDLETFDTSSVTDMSYMFFWCKSLTDLDLETFKTDNVTNMSAMFAYCASLTGLDLRTFNTENVTDMSNMFQKCASLTSLDLGSFKTDKVTDMKCMFFGCEGLESLNLSSFDTGNVGNMRKMFIGCSGLQEITFGDDFRTDKVTDMESMFENCKSLTSLNLSGFHTGQVTSMFSMFGNCSSLTTLNLKNFDTSNVMTITSMFAGCESLESLDLSNFNFSMVTTADELETETDDDDYSSCVFYDCPNLSAIDVPYGLTGSVLLPDVESDDPWYDVKGNTYKTLPQNLESSILLSKDKQTFQATSVTEENTAVTLGTETLSYDGTEQRPTVTVEYTDAEKKITVTLKEGTDYTLSYKNNIDAGDYAKVIITGKGSYRGTLTQTFAIAKKKITVEANDMTIFVNDPLPGSTETDAQQFSCKVSGLAEKDTLEDALDKAPVYTCSIVSTAEEGSYDIVPSGAEAGKNYEITGYKKGTLSVIVLSEVYTITFDLGGHGNDIVQRLETGVLISKPDDPTAEGYVFAGWYKDAACTKAWDFDTEIAQADTTIYACWLENKADNSESLLVQEIPNQTYTGSQLKPAVKVYASDGTTLLKSGKDYTIKYWNNTNVDSVNEAGGIGTVTTGNDIDTTYGFNKLLPYVEITGKGNYQGTVYRNFHIREADISDGNGNEAAGITLKYTEQFVAATGNKTLSPFGSIKYKKAMTAETDFQVELEAVEGKVTKGSKLLTTQEELKAAVGRDSQKKLPYINAGYAGEFTLTIKGLGNYEGQITKTIKVSSDSKHLIKNASITLGAAQKKMAYAAEGVELTAAYYDKTQKKYFAFKDDGTGNWDATKELNAKNCFVVKSGADSLCLYKDYVVTYTDNTAVGKATMTITGINDYTGSKSVSFNITGTAFNAKNISFAKPESNTKTDDDAAFAKSMTYTGKALTQNGVELKDKDKTLVLGTDYTISYKNNVKKGTATMTFTGRPEAGYTGSFKKTFKITEATNQTLVDMISVSVSEAGKEAGFTGVGTTAADTAGKNPPAAVYTLQGDISYSREGVKPIDKITLKNRVTGAELQLNKDYTVKYANNAAVGKTTDTNKPTMTITFKGNYKGYILVYFNIAATKLDEAYNAGNVKVTVSEMTYSEKTKEYKPNIKVTDGKKTLKKDTDYEVEYGKNTKADVDVWLAAIKAGGKTLAELEALRPYAIIRAKETTAKGAKTGYTNGENTVKVYLPVYESASKLNTNNLYVVVEEATYTGGQVTPVVTVYYGNQADVKKAKQAAGNPSENDLVNTYKLTKLYPGQADLSGIGGVGADYTLTYGPNIAAGKNKGTVTIKGNGQYGGSVTVKFTINSKTVFQNK